MSRSSPMRDIAAYSFHASFDSVNPAKADQAFKTIQDKVAPWLQAKGATRQQATGEGGRFGFKDGRVAELVVSRVSASIGRICTWQLSEPIEAGEFQTALHLGQSGPSLVVFCTLTAGTNGSIVAPLSRIAAHCPNILRDILELDMGWRIGSTPVSVRKGRFIGREGGARLIALLRDPNRALPVIVVSEDSGFLVHPDLDDRLARDTVGLAKVFSIDVEASWELTRQLGQDWSCFNGAVRIYWPGMAARFGPFGHWLWTAAKLTSRVSSTEEAARQLTDQLRWKLMGISTLSVERPPLLDDIRQTASREGYERLRKEAESSQDFAQLAELYDKQRQQVETENQQLRDQIARLQTDLENERLCRAWDGAQDEEIEPETEAPPATVQEAKNRAQKRFGKELLFGRCVDQGIAALSQDAGPPDKVFNYLETLAGAVKAKNSSALGTSLKMWLKQHGVRVSTESETIKKSAAEMEKRTWDWGNGQWHKFELHLKPSDATSPDRCVRIYFDWCERRKIIVVGWIGRHPD
jgi:hypothetical protein